MVIASSSTFRPHAGRVIRNLFRQLHGTEALVYSSHLREAEVFSYLAIIFGRIASSVPWFFRSTAVPMRCQCSSRISAGAGVGRGSLKLPAIECLTFCFARPIRGSRHAQNPLSGELSITHHALSPPPSHHHLYIIRLIN